MPNSKKCKQSLEQIEEAKRTHLNLFSYSRRENKTTQNYNRRASISRNDRYNSNFLEVANIVPPTNGSGFYSYEIPQDLKNILVHILKTNLGTNEKVPLEWRNVLAQGLNACVAINAQDLQNSATVNLEDMSNNYQKFFQFLLWLEEISGNVSQYNVNKVTMTNVQNNFELKVRGLAEKRPHVNIRDIVSIKEHGNKETAYQGRVMEVFKNKIWIGKLHTWFHEMFKNNPAIKLDVTFEPNRVTINRMHCGIKCIAQKNYLMKSLFPKIRSDTRPSTFEIKSNNDLFNKEIFSNGQQTRAIQNIVNNTSGRSPYIVFGPPGTGKTVTIAEAILQIKRKFENCTILVCTPTNASCNAITDKLIPWCTTTELIRVFPPRICRDGINQNVKRYSNWSDDKFVPINGTQLQHYRVVITTLAASGWYLNQTYYKFCPDYVFIDEAAQASEPEAVIAIALLAEHFKQIVLAGDPKQLGPFVLSEQAKGYGFGVSILERLMKTVLYKNNDFNYITMLQLNFRNHPDILHLPNQLFYDNKLMAVSREALNDPIASICVFSKINSSGKKTGQYKNCSASTEFYAVCSKEKYDKFSSSYFNPEEVNTVMETVRALCNLTETKVTQNDIGVITPYNSQVHKIKNRLKQEGFKFVEVGSTENFQGREKRIIIISTVRARESLSSKEEKNGFGFIKVKERFNVSLTRAKSKLIVIGCPIVLQSDQEYWSKYMEYCLSHNSYFGPRPRVQ